jgi:hypothetical protein
MHLGGVTAHPTGELEVDGGCVPAQVVQAGECRGSRAHVRVAGEDEAAFAGGQQLTVVGGEAAGHSGRSCWVSGADGSVGLGGVLDQPGAVPGEDGLEMRRAGGVTPQRDRDDRGGVGADLGGQVFRVQGGAAGLVVDQDGTCAERENRQDGGQRREGGQGDAAAGARAEETRLSKLLGGQACRTSGLGAATDIDEVQRKLTTSNKRRLISPPSLTSAQRNSVWHARRAANSPHAEAATRDRPVAALVPPPCSPR